MVGLLLVIPKINLTVNAKTETILEADSGLCETLGYALINSLGKPIDKAISEIYKEDKDAPENLTWASFQTEILKIKQLYGVGGAYEITLKVYPYYRAHITYGEDIIVVSADGELIKYEHLKTYPKVEFN
jgi:hypothetical protein